MQNLISSDYKILITHKYIKLILNRIPTLIIAECVLVYLEPEDSSALIKFFNNKLKQSIFIVYEQVLNLNKEK